MLLDSPEPSSLHDFYFNGPPISQRHGHIGFQDQPEWPSHMILHIWLFHPHLQYWKMASYCQQPPGFYFGELKAMYRSLFARHNRPRLGRWAARQNPKGREETLRRQAHRVEMSQTQETRSFQGAGGAGCLVAVDLEMKPIWRIIHNIL